MKARVLSACVFVPVILGSALIGGWVFLAIVLVICDISAWEFGRLFDQHDGMRIPLTVLIISVIVLILARWFLGIGASHRILTACIMAAILCGTLLCEEGVPKSALSFTVLTTGMVYIGWLGGYMISIRQLPNGAVRFILVLLLIWVGDMGAFAVGRRIGKHKMLKVVSPKKSWEGLAGGILFTILIAVLAALIVPPVKAILTVKQAALLGLTIALTGPFGDFGESMIKRCFGVKDSSNLIPGHGGFFDRFDSCFFAMPAAYYFFELIQLSII